MEENKETPSSPVAAANKSDESYSQCMSPTSEERKTESMAADSQSTAIKEPSMPPAVTNTDDQYSLPEEEAVMRTEITVAIKDTA